MKTFFAILALFVVLVASDMYMHNPRGSNNRNNENNVNRNNGNRLFDSQNNGKGGYCRGEQKEKFYTGSLLQISWTNQHGCGNPKLGCQIVIQYMCGDIRDGTSTNTIDPDDPDNEENGRHESVNNYIACDTRRRNAGLFAADQGEENGLNANQDARRTRQNPNGNRRGFECPEERDYYPYWHPTEWRDIAVMTDKIADCDWYKSESQNVKSKHHCINDNNEPLQYNNEIACNQADPEENAKWVAEGKWGIGSPQCVAAPFSRDNHLGNGILGEFNNYKWIIPSSLSGLPTEKIQWHKTEFREATEDDPIDDSDLEEVEVAKCVIRVRYNITGHGLKSATEAKWNGPGEFLDYKYNDAVSPVKTDPIKFIGSVPMELAVDTTQYARTFQDRSHVLYLINRPIEQNRRIYNVNVQGKRGNIVQTYPAVEYDFNPTSLEVTQNDYVHFQANGCDNNPQGNAGEGTAGTDRSNIVQIENLGASYPAKADWLDKNTKMFGDDETARRYAFGNEANCDPNPDNDQDEDNCEKLNPTVKQYFNGGLQRMSSTGTFYYMSTRNNNFTNRGQKADLTVKALLPGWAIGLIVTGAVLLVASAGVFGAMFYAKQHPHSKVNEILSKF